MTSSRPDEFDETAVRFTDKRRIDPETGEVRASPAPAGPRAAPAGNGSGPGAEPAGPDAGAPEVSGAPDSAKLDELTADLQRVTAEYANYRKRVERDREAVAELAVVAVLADLLPVLDDIDRARGHGELDGAFKSVGDSLHAVVARLGLKQFGEVGDPFDPAIHEALTHSEGEDRERPICSQVFELGYRFKDRVVRPARVGVSE